MKPWVSQASVVVALCVVFVFLCTCNNDTEQDETAPFEIAISDDLDPYDPEDGSSGDDDDDAGANCDDLVDQTCGPEQESTSTKVATEAMCSEECDYWGSGDDWGWYPDCDGICICCWEY